MQEDLDKKIRDLEIQHTELLRQTGSLQNQIEEKTRCVKEMEQMMNTERTRSLLEVARLKETLRKRKRKGGGVEGRLDEEEKGETIPSINETPIKVVNSPSSFIQGGKRRSASFTDREDDEEGEEDEGEEEESEEGKGKGEKGDNGEKGERKGEAKRKEGEETEEEEGDAERRVNTSTDTSSTVLSEMLNNLSNVVNELGQQLNPS